MLRPYDVSGPNSTIACPTQKGASVYWATSGFCVAAIVTFGVSGLAVPHATNTLQTAVIVIIRAATETCESVIYIPPQSDEILQLKTRYCCVEDDSNENSVRRREKNARMSRSDHEGAACTRALERIPACRKLPCGIARGCGIAKKAKQKKKGKPA